MRGTRESGTLGVARPPLVWVVLALSLVDAVILAGLGIILARKGDVNWRGGFSIQAAGPDSPPVVAGGDGGRRGREVAAARGQHPGD